MYPRMLRSLAVGEDRVEGDMYLYLISQDVTFVKDPLQNGQSEQFW